MSRRDRLGACPNRGSIQTSSIVEHQTSVLTVTGANPVWVSGPAFTTCTRSLSKHSRWKGTYPNRRSLQTHLHFLVRIQARLESTAWPNWQRQRSTAWLLELVRPYLPPDDPPGGATSWYGAQQVERRTEPASPVLGRPGAGDPCRFESGPTSLRKGKPSGDGTALLPQRA